MGRSDGGDVGILYRTFNVSVDRDKGFSTGVNFVTVAVYICAVVVIEVSLVSALDVMFAVAGVIGRAGASSFGGRIGTDAERSNTLR